MNVVPNLLPLVAKNRVFASLQVALDQVTQKTMQLYPRMIGACQAASPQATGRHLEVAAVLLNHDVRRNFGGTEQGMFGLVDGKGFRNAVLIRGIVVFPSSLQLL